MQAHASAVKWRTKPFPLYDEMLALVEGRHATGENVFRVSQTTSGDAKSDDEVNEVKQDVSAEGPESIETFFTDWVCPHLYFSVYSIK